MTGGASAELTDRNIELIAASLPNSVDLRRLQLLPAILREWYRIDLQEHLLREPQGANQARLKRLERVGKLAGKLSRSLEELDDRGRFGIAFHLALGQGKSILGISQAELAALKERLREEQDFLTRLATVAPNATWKLGRGQPRNTVAYLVMQDLAAIYEWLTGRKATRVVDRISGEESGPFWRFASALWPVVFGKGTHGLAAAMKNWAAARTRYVERSPLIANVALRHPAWGIFQR